MPRNRDIFAHSLPIMLFDPALDCRIKRRAFVLALQFPKSFLAEVRDVWLLPYLRSPWFVLCPSGELLYALYSIMLQVISVYGIKLFLVLACGAVLISYWKLLHRLISYVR
jgi:hypothetical protein